MVPQNTFLIEQNSEYQHDSTEYFLNRTKTVNVSMVPQNTFLIEQNSEYQHDSTEYFLNRTKQ